MYSPQYSGSYFVSDLSLYVCMYVCLSIQDLGLPGLVSTFKISSTEEDIVMDIETKTNIEIDTPYIYIAISLILNFLCLY